MAEMTVLASTESYRIVYHRVTGQGKLVLTFGTISDGLADMGFGSRYLLGRGIDTVYVSCAPEDQFQSLSRDALCGHLGAELCAREIYCYGTSGGGYAALYFGGALGARVLAGSPLTRRPWDVAPGKWVVDWRHESLEEAPRTPHPPVIVYDPQVVRDATFVDTQIRPVYPQGHYIPLDLAGHKVFESMQLVGVFGGFANAFFSDGRVVPVEIPKDKSHVHYKRLADEHREAGRPDRAVSALRASLNLRVTHVALADFMRLSAQLPPASDLKFEVARWLEELPEARRAAIRELKAYSFLMDRNAAPWA